MPAKKQSDCKRPYSLGKRRVQSGEKRAAILAVARKRLESDGYPGLTLETLARESNVTRQTVYNLFRNKAGVIEALFDQIALDAGMERMRTVMQETEPEAMLSGFVQVFTDFWAKDRVFLRRIRGIAAIDPDLGAVLGARNERRRMAASRVVSMLERRRVGTLWANKQKVAALVALTSFEFFDVLAENCDSVSEAAQMIQTIVKKAMD